LDVVFPLPLGAAIDSRADVAVMARKPARRSADVVCFDTRKERVFGMQISSQVWRTTLTVLNTLSIATVRRVRRHPGGRFYGIY
jgi:hypothetical protein